MPIITGICEAANIRIVVRTFVFNLLDEHLYLSYASEAYTDFILLVLDVLEKRERAVDPDEVDETWEEFKRRYLCPQEDDEEDDNEVDAYDDFEG